MERGYFILWQQAIVCACLNGSYPVLFLQERTKVAVEREKNKHEIVYAGEIDHHSSKELRSKTESALEQMGGRNIIFGFQEVTFMDSAGIGVMIGRYKQVQSLGGRIAIACPNEKIEEMIQLSGLSRLLPTFVSLDAAIAYAEGRKSDAV